MQVATDDQASNCLLFSIENMTFGVDTAQVVALIEPPEITHLPVMPPYVSGSFSFRGHAAMAIDTRALLHIADKQKTKRRAFIVTQVNEDTVAFEVDKVLAISTRESHQSGPDFFSAAGMDLFNVDPFGLAIGMSFKQMIENANVFGTEEWQAALSEKGFSELLEGTTIDTVETHVVENCEEVESDEEPAENAEVIADIPLNSEEMTMTLSAQDGMNNEVDASAELDLCPDEKELLEEAKTDQFKISIEPSMMESPAPQELDGVEQAKGQNEQSTEPEFSSLTESSEFENVINIHEDAPEVEEEFISMTLSTEQDADDTEEIHPVVEQTPAIEVSASVDSQRIIITADEYVSEGKTFQSFTQLEEETGFREVPLTKATKNIFAARRKGSLYYAGISSIIMLVSIAGFGTYYGLTRTGVDVPSLETQETVQPVAVPETDRHIDSSKPNQIVEASGAIGATAEVARVVKIETPEFSITVDRPLDNPDKVAPSGMVLNLNVEPETVSSAEINNANRKLATTRYIVLKGDTLWSIAEKFLENPFLYPEIAENSGIKNPDLIYPRDVVTITRRVKP